MIENPNPETVVRNIDFEQRLRASDHWRENNGRVPAFGGIIGYVLVLIAGYGGFDFGLPFSITGDLAGAMQKVKRLGEARRRTMRNRATVSSAATKIGEGTARWVCTCKCGRKEAR